MNSEICAICEKPLATESGAQFCLECREKYGLGEPEPRARAAPRVQWEAAEQEALFTWANYQLGTFPELELLYHVPNGGRRNKYEAAKLKRQGVKPGVPDIVLPVPRAEFHGLYIELKYGDNKPTKDQKKWLERLKEQGYKAITCYGWREAAGEIEKYLRRNQNEYRLF